MNVFVIPVCCFTAYLLLQFHPTVHIAMVYVIRVCWQLARRIRMERSSILILLASCQQTRMTYTIAVCTVENSWWGTEELSKTCRLSFQNKFEKLVHLFGFIIRIRHEAWSHECKKCSSNSWMGRVKKKNCSTHLLEIY